MWQQTKQVIFTYGTHRGWYLGAILLGLMVIPNLVLSTSGNRPLNDRAQPIMMMLGMPMFFLMPFLVGHVKAQFAHPRARLTPHFVPAHLIVLGGLMIVALVGFPLLIASCTSFSWLSLSAVAIAIAAPMAWGNHRVSFPLLLLGLVVFYSLLTTWGLNWWFIDASQHVAAHTLIVLVGGVALAAWMGRLSQLREEMDDYQRAMQWRIPRRSGAEESEQRRIMAAQVGRNKLNAWVGDLWNDHLGSYHGGRPFDLVRLMRHGIAITPMEYQALFISAFVLVIMLFFTQFSFLAQAGIGALFFPILAAIMMPGVMGGEMLARRRSLTAAE